VTVQPIRFERNASGWIMDLPQRSRGRFSRSPSDPPPSGWWTVVVLVLIVPVLFVTQRVGYFLDDLGFQAYPIYLALFITLVGLVIRQMHARPSIHTPLRVRRDGFTLWLQGTCGSIRGRHIRPEFMQGEWRLWEEGVLNSLAFQTQRTRLGATLVVRDRHTETSYGWIQVSDRDLELLSGYLEAALSEARIRRDQRKLEASAGLHDEIEPQVH
jgi:hypothetical protein